MHLTNFVWIALIFVIQFDQFLVSCDLSIVDKSTNEIVFQTASDFVRTSECGTFFQREPALLVISQPLYICEDPIVAPPISYHQLAYSTLKSIFLQLTDLCLGTNLHEELQEPPWVLVTGIEESGGCSLQKKLKNVETAGYSAVLLASNHGAKKVFNSSSILLSDEKVFVDVHLINPWDAQHVLSKYAYPDNGNGFRIQGPPREQNISCKDIYYSQNGFLHKLQSNIPLINGLMSWIKEHNWITRFISYYDNVNLYEILQTKGLEIVGSLFVAMYIFVPFIILLIMYKTGYGREETFQERFRRNQRFWGERTDYTEPPPSPPPPPRQPFQTIYRTIVYEHLARLDMSPNEELTTANVNRAYKRKALLEHPDKHPETERARKSEKFKLIIKSKEFLLGICIDANHLCEE